MPGLGARPKTVGGGEPRNVWAREEYIQLSQAWLKKNIYIYSDFDGEIGGGKNQNEHISEEEFCAVVQVTKPRLGRTKKRGEPGGQMNVTWL